MRFSIISFYILLLFVSFPDFCFSRLIKGDDGVWREEIQPPRQIEQTRSETEGQTREKIQKCDEEFPNNTRKAVECILKGSVFERDLDRTVLRECSQFYDGNIPKVLQCYTETIVDKAEDRIDETRRELKNDLLDIIQEGSLACGKEHKYNSRAYKQCKQHWRNERQKVMEEY